MKQFEINKIKLTKTEIEYVIRAIENIDVMSYPISVLRNDMVLDSFLEKIYYRLFTKNENYITEIELISILYGVFVLNMYLIENKAEPFTELEMKFFKQSDKFFDKHNHHKNILVKWQDYKKYVHTNKQKVYVR